MVIRRQPETGERRLDLLRWALTPSWTKLLKQARPMSAGSETAANGMFKAALASQCCVVPAETVQIPCQHQIRDRLRAGCRGHGEAQEGKCRE